ncbi:hypothetical protein KAW64_09300, partial [bacterium]|nr:hypothetical protein [bacterium]
MVMKTGAGSMKRYECFTVPLRPIAVLAGRIGLAAGAVALTVLSCTPCLATQIAEPARPATSVRARATSSREDPPDTLWIFDADFEDLLGDNSG